MIVQAVNVGHAVTGAHSFELYVPGAGQQATVDGCARQFNDNDVNDFDCGHRYGGCNVRAGCAKVPTALQAGCEWKFDWLKWLQDDGTTNNPYVRFRRVKCPPQLTAKTRSTPLDDNDPSLPSASPIS